MTPHERLRRLADELRKPMPATIDFDLTAWREELHDEHTNVCITVCCAVGLATMVPEFSAEGFVAIRNADGELVPTFEGLRAFDAASRFFGLDAKDTHWLLQRSSYPGDPKPEDVAARIDAILRRSA